MNSNSLVSMKNISKSFGSIEALKNANFDLNKAKKVFGYSILYLFLIFVLFLIDSLI